MAAKKLLKGRPIDLGQGVIFTPGRRLAGSVQELPLPRPTRKIRGISDPWGRLESDLVRNGFLPRRVLEITPPRPTRDLPLHGAEGPGTLEVQTRPDEVPVVLYQAEDGTATWAYPTEALPTRVTRGRGPVPAGFKRGADKSWRLTVPFRVPSSPPPQERRTRGLATWIGKRIVKLFVFKVVDWAATALLKELVERVEAHTTKEGFKPVTKRFLAPADPPLTQWDFLQGPRLLAFIHGTFSSCRGGFGDLEGTSLSPLIQAYRGNVVGFDHWTLSKSPSENAQDFLRGLPTVDGLQVDLVTHSRGGLVARVLTELQAQTSVRFNRVVFVGTPNAGTPLAATNHLGMLIDHLTNVFLFLPKFSVVMVVDLILSVVKWLATRVTGALPGLAAQNPSDPFLQQLNSASSIPRAQYAAVAANYEPEEGLLNRLKDAGADLLMQVDNDLVVPTGSITTLDPGASPPPLMADRVYHFDGGKVHHVNYFEQEQTVQFIRQVLQ